MLVVAWSRVKVHAAGVFDVSYSCPHCGYEGWARASGEAEGSDTAVYGRPSEHAARFHANTSRSNSGWSGDHRACLDVRVR
jgi:hypothetical protein